MARFVTTGKSVLVRTLAAGLLAGALAVPALVDDKDRDGWPGWGMGWGMGQMMGGWGMRGPMMGFGPDAMIDRIDGRLAFMKTELKITEAQDAAWNALAETVRTTAQAHNDMMRSAMQEMHDGDFFDKPLPERLQFQETHMEARLEQIKAVREAVDKLYAVLDDTQKKAADDIVLPTMGMGMGMGRGFGPGMMNR